MAGIRYPLVEQGDIIYGDGFRKFFVVFGIEGDDVLLRSSGGMEETRVKLSPTKSLPMDYTMCKTREQMIEIFGRNGLDLEGLSTLSLDELDREVSNENILLIPLDVIPGAVERYYIPTDFYDDDMDAIEILKPSYTVHRFKYVEDEYKDDESKQQEAQAGQPQQVDQPPEEPSAGQPQQVDQPPEEPSAKAKQPSSQGNMLARFWNWVMRRDNARVTPAEKEQLEQGVAVVEKAWGKKNWTKIAAVLVAGGGLTLLYKLYTRWKESPDAQVQNPASDSSESSDNDLLQPEDRTSYPDQLRAMETFDARVNRRLTDLGFNRPSYSDRKSMLMRVVEAIGARRGVQLNDTSVVQQILREELDLANDYETASEQLKRSERRSMLLREAFAAEFPLINWAEVVT